MTTKLTGKHILVTGGNRGIGEAIVRRFIDEGARVVFTGQDYTEDVKKSLIIAQEIGAEYRLLEITSENNWKALADEFIYDQFDVLVNNAGGLNFPKLLHELSTSEWRKDLEVNLTGPFFGMRTFIPPMVERGYGSIINIASMSGVRAQIDGAAYQAAKGGLRLLTKNAAMAYAKTGVRINAINPGYIETKAGEEMPERDKWFFNRIPMGRTGVPSEVASAAVFLASDDSIYITGIDLDVDGGYNI